MQTDGKMVRWAETKLLLTNTHAWCQYQQVCFVELHKIMSLTWKEQVTDHSIYFSPSVVKSNKSDLKIMNQFMFLARGIAGALNVLFFMETPWNNIFLFLPFFCFSSASRSHFSGVHEVMFIMIRPEGEGGQSLPCDGWRGQSPVFAVIALYSTSLSPRALTRIDLLSVSVVLKWDVREKECSLTVV